MADWDPVTPDEVPYDEPWYRQRGPLTAAIVVGLAVVFFIAALLVWWLVGGDDDTLVTTDDTTTTVVTTSTTVAPATVPPVTEPPGTDPPTTEPPVTEPPVTEPPVTTPPPTLPPITGPTTTTTTSVPVVTVPPSPEATVWDIVSSSPDLSRLRQLLIDAELDDVIRGEEPFTLLAPSNDSFDLFERSPGGAAVLADQLRLTTLLLRHLIFPEIYTADELFALDEVLVATGELLSIDGSARTIDGAELIVIDVVGSNGMLHVVERVLSP